jgi:hypothetical protein
MIDISYDQIQDRNFKIREKEKNLITDRLKGLTEEEREADTIFSYKCSNSYSPSHERTLLWNDSELNIDWGYELPIVSSKDRDGILFKNFKSPF